MAISEIPLERPNSKILRDSYFALDAQGSTVVHTAVSLDATANVDIDLLIALDFKATNDSMGDKLFVTSRCLTRSEWLQIDDNIESFYALERQSIINIKANWSDHIPYRVIRLLLEKYDSGDADFFRTMSAFDDGFDADSVVELQRNLMRAEYTDMSSVAIMYAIEELVGDDPRYVKQPELLESYNRCMDALGEDKVSSLIGLIKDVDPGALVRRSGATVSIQQDDGVKEMKLAADWYENDAEIQVVSEVELSVNGAVFSHPQMVNASIVKDLRSSSRATVSQLKWPEMLDKQMEKLPVDFDRTALYPISVVIEEVTVVLKDINDSELAENVQHTLVDLKLLSDSVAPIRASLVTQGLLREDEKFGFEYFCGSLSMSYKDKMLRSFSGGDIRSPEDLVSQAVNDVTLSGESRKVISDLFSRADLEKLYPRIYPKSKKNHDMSLDGFVATFRAKFPEHCFKFYAKDSANASHVLTLKLNDEPGLYLSAGSADGKLLSPIVTSDSMIDSVSEFNERYGYLFDSSLDVGANEGKINRAHFSVEGVSPGARSPTTRPQVLSLVKSELNSTLNLTGKAQESAANKIVDAIKNDGVCIYGEVRNGSQILVLTKEQIFERHDGNRIFAAAALTRELYNRESYSRAKSCVFDGMELSDPARYEQEKLLNFHGKPTNAADRNLENKRQDTGKVFGLALKHDKYDSADEAIARLLEIPFVEMVRKCQKNKVWTVRQNIRLKDADVDPRIASLESAYRNNLPSSPHSLTDRGSLDFYVRATMGLRDVFSNPDSDFEAVKKDLREWHKSYLPLEISSDWRASLDDDCRASWPKHAQDFWLTPLRGVTPHQAFVGKDGKGGLKNLVDSASTASWDDIIKKKTGLSTVQKRSFTDLPILETLERSGPEQRESYELRTLERMICEDFALSGVEYGNWINQTEGFTHMEFAYDSLADLADLLGVDRQAVSLGGRLGLCLGGRGKGGKNAPIAHFEPSNVAINLTREHGAGSLLHEYGHALGNYFARLHSPLHRDMFVHFSSDTSAGRPGSAGRMRPNMYKAWKNVYDAVMVKPHPTMKGVMIDSDFVAYGKSLDEMEERDRPYWGAPVELFARMMERYGYDKMQAKGQMNNYLIRPDRFSLISDGGLYPSSEAMKDINVGMDSLLKEVKLKPVQVNHPYLGKTSIPVMYSHDLSHSGITTLSPNTLASLAWSNITHILGENTAALCTTKNLHDDAGSSVAGAWDEARNVILLSEEFGTMGTVYHETYHAAESKIITSDEISMLNLHLEVGTHAYNNLYNVMSHNGVEDVRSLLDSPAERRAYAFQYYASGELMLEKESGGGIFAKLKELLSQLYSVITNAGYQKPQDLFNALLAGDLAHRSYVQSLKQAPVQSADITQSHRMAV
jgi:hypothetical protein